MRNLKLHFLSIKCQQAFPFWRLLRRSHFLGFTSDKACFYSQFMVPSFTFQANQTASPLLSDLHVSLTSFYNSEPPTSILQLHSTCPNIHNIYGSKFVIELKSPTQHKGKHMDGFQGLECITLGKMLFKFPQKEFRNRERGRQKSQAGFHLGKKSES